MGYLQSIQKFQRTNIKMACEKQLKIRKIHNIKSPQNKNKAMQKILNDRMETGQIKRKKTDK